MKFISAEVNGKRHQVELSRRNLTTLLAMLDNQHGGHRLIAPGQEVEVIAVEDDEHYTDRDPGLIEINGELV